MDRLDGRVGEIVGQGDGLEWGSTVVDGRCFWITGRESVQWKFRDADVEAMQECKYHFVIDQPSE